MTHTWLVAYDFSKCADKALNHAATHLAKIGGEVVLHHVCRPIATTMAVEMAALGGMFTDTDVAIQKTASERLGHVADDLRARYPDLVVSTYVSSGMPPDEVVRYAAERDVEQVVIGSHGRRGFKRALLGSVAERVVRYADRPVLVVKGADDPA